MNSNEYSRFSVVPSASYLDIESRTNTHPIVGRGHGLRGYIEAAWRDDMLLLDPPPVLHLELPIERLSSGDSLRDGEMKKFLGGREHPTIVSELRNIEASGQPGEYSVKGAITVKGKTGEHDGRIVIHRDRHRLHIEGSEMIYMRKFGLEPPKILMFQVNAYVRVTLRLVAELET